MKLRLFVCLFVLAGGIGLGLWPSVTPAVADSRLVTAATALAPLGMSSDDKYAYVGSKKCKACHSAAHKSWAKTKMGQAFEILKPGNSTEMKEKHGLDVKKDYSKDESCLKCHTTGFGANGGYAVPDGSDKKAVKKAKALQGVGCESCHGPGSEYVKLHKEIQKAKRKYKVEEMYAAGMKKVDKDGCLDCHNDKSPTAAKGTPFDFEKSKDADSHEHKPLKQREG